MNTRYPIPEFSQADKTNYEKRFGDSVAQSGVRAMEYLQRNNIESDWVYCDYYGLASLRRSGVVVICQCEKCRAYSVADCIAPS